MDATDWEKTARLTWIVAPNIVEAPMLAQQRRHVAEDWQRPLIDLRRRLRIAELLRLTVEST